MPFARPCCVLVLACSCARPDPHAEVGRRAGDTEQPTVSTPELLPVDPSSLIATSGSVVRTSPAEFAVRSAEMRAELGREVRDAVEIEFVYRGPTAENAPLGSGELRRQIGLKLRAHDTCNVLYAMWHIEPSRGLAVLVKSNPGQHLHSQCGDRGYASLAPSWVRDAPGIRAGERHALRATIQGDVLQIVADGWLRWMGKLPPEAVALDGPVGLRTDNGEFDVNLRASAPRAHDVRSQR